MDSSQKSHLVQVAPHVFSNCLDKGPFSSNTEIPDRGSLGHERYLRSSACQKELFGNSRVLSSTQRSCCLQGARCSSGRSSLTGDLEQEPQSNQVRANALEREQQWQDWVRERIQTQKQLAGKSLEFSLGLSCRDLRSANQVSREDVARHGEL